jgi:uncharacterized membrane protein (UPF0127 family)
VSQESDFALRAGLAKTTVFSGGRRATILVNGSPLSCEIALTPKEQWLGLSGRTDLDPDAGMVFVSKNPTLLSFWMQGTALPLTVAFVREDGQVVALNDLEPFSEVSVVATEPVSIAIEANRGWFESRGLKVGDVVYLNLG